jgi:hypothetical protein
MKSLSVLSLKFHFSNNHRSKVRDPWPSLGSLGRDGTFDIGALHVAFGRDYDRRVVLKHHPLTADSPDSVLLPDYHRTERLLSKFRRSALYHNRDVITNRSRRQSAQPAVVSGYVYDAQRLCACVIGACDYRIKRN